MWGSSGSNVGNSIGGKGAYVSGVISFHKTQILYLYIGSQGSPTKTTGPTFNGGGYNIQSPGNGGGCTDIRLKKGNDFESLKSRIIVS